MAHIYQEEIVPEEKAKEKVSLHKKARWNKSIMFLGICFLVGMIILSSSFIYISKQNNITSIKNSETSRYQMERQEDIIRVIDTKTGNVHVLNGNLAGKIYKIKR